MVELQIHAFSWCIHHQQPVIALTSGEDNPATLFWVGLSVEDAQALCQVDTWPPSGRRRVHKLVSDVLRATDSHIQSISLVFNDDPMLSAQVTLCSPVGPNAVSCSSVDAILLATEHRIPLAMAANDWRRLQSFIDTASENSVGSGPPSPQPPDVFRDFIESLDLEDDYQ